MPIGNKYARRTCGIRPVLRLFPVVLPTVPATIARRWLTAGLTVGLVCLAGPARSQDTPEPFPVAPAPAFKPDPATLERIRKGLTSESILGINKDPLRFYLQVTATKPTFADYLKGSGRWFEISATAPPSSNGQGSRLPAGTGIDLGALFGRLERSLTARTIRNIREQIDRELEAIERAKVEAAPAPASPQ